VSHDKVRRDKPTPLAPEEGFAFRPSASHCFSTPRTSRPFSEPRGAGPRPGSPFMTPQPRLHDAGGPTGRSPALLLAWCARCTAGPLLKRGTCPGQSDTVGAQPGVLVADVRVGPPAGAAPQRPRAHGPIPKCTHDERGRRLPMQCRIRTHYFADVRTDLRGGRSPRILGASTQPKLGGVRLQFGCGEVRWGYASRLLWLSPRHCLHLVPRQATFALSATGTSGRCPTSYVRAFGARPARPTRPLAVVPSRGSGQRARTNGVKP
jgi:hypothetical protein